MNLIEQLGGYEKAKEIVFDPLHPQMTHVSNDGRHWVNEEFSHIPEIQEQIPTMIRIKDIRKALLEYRRQHNIFEVGDKVVFGSGLNADLFTIKSKPKKKNGVLLLPVILPNGPWLDLMEQL